MYRKFAFSLIPLFLALLFFSCSKKPVTPKNSSPVINAIEASPNIVSKGGTVYLNLAVTDPDENKMFFEWTCSDGQFYSDSLLQNESNTSDPCWWKAPLTEGNFTINVTCTDSIGDNPVFIDTNVTVSVSVYSLDTIISSSKFDSPFAMYLDSQGRMYVTDPGLSAVDYFDGNKWYSWNFSGLDTTIDTIIDTTSSPPDTIVDTLIGKVRFDTPTAITVDENKNLIYVADALVGSTRVSVYNIDSMFTPSDTVIIPIDSVQTDTFCLYGFQFRLNDKNDLHFSIKAPYSFVYDPSSEWLYLSTGVSILAYDSTSVPTGWTRNWSFATATQGINFEGHGLKLYNGNLYLASFGVKNDTLHNLVREFTDITNPNGPTEVFAFADSTLQYVNGIAIAPDGHIFVTEGGGSYSFNRVVEYDENGNFIRSFGSLGDKPDQLNSPSDIFVDNTGKIYVVDTGNHCIKVFSK